MRCGPGPAGSFGLVDLWLAGCSRFWLGHVRGSTGWGGRKVEVKRREPDIFAVVPRRGWQ